MDANNRKLTRFFCQELLYEFMSGNLDMEKQKSMDDYLTGCRESQRELERLNRGLQYSSVASRLGVSQELREALLNFEPQWKRTWLAWTHWTSRRGWRALPYIFLLLTLGLSLFLLKPWRPRLNRDLVLFEQIKSDGQVSHPSIPLSVEILSGTPPAVPAVKIELPEEPPGPLQVPRQSEETVPASEPNSAPEISED